MEFFKNYVSLIHTGLSQMDTAHMENVAGIIQRTKQQGGKLILAGNGGSAAIASHIAVDFTKTAKIRATNFNESDLITCFANDYGYEHWVEKAIEFYADPQDAVILISCSGKSPNLLNASHQAKSMKLPLITFSGFSEDNPLRKLGDVNLWVDSRGSHIVEMVHHTWLVCLMDFITGTIEY